jgi:hypothetical protein
MRYQHYSTVRYLIFLACLAEAPLLCHRLRTAKPHVDIEARMIGWLFLSVRQETRQSSPMMTRLMTKLKTTPMTILMYHDCTSKQVNFLADTSRMQTLQEYGVITISRAFFHA